jgi:hypothetical protein
VLKIVKSTTKTENASSVSIDTGSIHPPANVSELAIIVSVGTPMLDYVQPAI